LFDLIRVINPTGHLGVIGVYLNQDPRAHNEFEKEGGLVLPWGDLWMKGITVDTGQAPTKNYHYTLCDLIIMGKARPGIIIANHYRIYQSQEAYDSIDKRNEKIKAVFNFF
jgi:glutathione-independent formaldehyde dehydrogenase